MPAMDHPPWERDHGLSTGQVARALAGALGPAAGGPLAFLGAGWDFDVYAVGPEQVARVPRRRAEEERLRREVAVLGWLGGRLGVAIPEPRSDVRRAAGLPHPYALFTRLAGTPLADLADSGRRPAGALRALGAVLARLHALAPPAAVLTAGRVRRLAGDLGRLRRVMARYLPDLGADAPPGLPDRAARFFADTAPPPPPFRGPFVLIHNDLGAGHVLLDPDEPERLAGILDWGDLALGDPAADLAGLVPCGGDEALALLADGYRSEAPLDDGVLARARFHGLCTALHDAWWEGQRAEPARRARILATLDRLLASG